MNKEFMGARLQLAAVDELTEMKSTVTLSDLTEDAPAAEVLAVRDALQGVLADPIESTRSIVTYEFV